VRRHFFPLAAQAAPIRTKYSYFVRPLREFEGAACCVFRKKPQWDALVRCSASNLVLRSGDQSGKKKGAGAN
jgi:hypothetical protein